MQGHRPPIIDMWVQCETFGSHARFHRNPSFLNDSSMPMITACLDLPQEPTLGSIGTEYFERQFHKQNTFHPRNPHSVPPEPIVLNDSSTKTTTSNKQLNIKTRNICIYIHVTFWKLYRIWFIMHMDGPPRLSEGVAWRPGRPGSSGARGPWK